jgi:putative SOS response-associated peptidase YedK
MASRQLKEAKRLGAPQEEIDRLEELIRKHEGLEGEDVYHTSGFAHPKLPLFILDGGEVMPRNFRWGLVPHWANNVEQAKEIAGKTLNARGETIFEKASFRESAFDKRCIIAIDCYFEYHHKNSKKFPHLIKHKTRDGLLLGGLWSEWIDPVSGGVYSSATIVTTAANKLKRRIHNNPKAAGPRMPLILDDEEAIQWLRESDPKAIKDLIKPYKEELEAYPVGPIAGKNTTPNTSEAHKKVEYQELNEQQSLF